MADTELHYRARTTPPRFVVSRSSSRLFKMRWPVVWEEHWLAA
jgi:hypothetical protein